MSDDLEDIANALYNNQTPKVWDTLGFLSLKPLSSWCEDLVARIKFLTDWYDSGTPNFFWFSGFFFP